MPSYVLFTCLTILIDNPQQQPDPEEHTKYQQFIDLIPHAKTSDASVPSISLHNMEIFISSLGNDSTVSSFKSLEERFTNQNQIQVSSCCGEGSIWIILIICWPAI